LNLEKTVAAALPVDLWMIAKVARATEAANRNFASFNLMNVTSAAHQLWLYELCDVYIEAVKPVLATQESSRDVLYFALEQGLKLLHPMMPFITEELFHRLPRADTSLPSICIASYPELDPQNLPARVLEAEAEFDQLFELIKSLRSTVMDRKLPPKTTKLALIPGSESLRIQLESNEMALQALVRTVGTIELAKEMKEEGEKCEKVELMNENEQLKCTIFIIKA
jgi:valyl-tRNA synthetase